MRWCCLLARQLSVRVSQYLCCCDAPLQLLGLSSLSLNQRLGLNQAAAAAQAATEEAAVSLMQTTQFRE
jgi:DNA-binding transcriptional regulator YdaS (Cro superfamily)